MFRFFLLSVAAADDEHSMLQARHALQKTKLGTRDEQTQSTSVEGEETQSNSLGAERILLNVQQLAEETEKNRQDPLRQCVGGWLVGDGTGGSETSVNLPVGKTTKEDCLTEARDQCPNANGASYDEVTQECFCEEGQTGLDSTAADKVNCRFFKDGTTDAEMSTALDSLQALVTSMIDEMKKEQAAAAQILTVSSDELDKARALQVPESEVTAKETERDDALTAWKTCKQDSDDWKSKAANDCKAWDDHADSLSGCQSACPCDKDAATFYAAASKWWSILDGGGWKQIKDLKDACDTSTTQKQHFAAECPNFEAAHTAAEIQYQTTLSTHLSNCDDYAHQLASHQTIVAQVMATQTQRQTEYDILKQVECYVEKMVTSTQSSELIAAACTASNFDGLGKDQFNLAEPPAGVSPVCVQVTPPTQSGVLIMKVVTNTFHFAHPHWENDLLFNANSPEAKEEDAKYATFMSASFNTIRLCVGGPSMKCMDHTLPQTYGSARELFTAGYIEDNTMDKGLWKTNFEATTAMDCVIQKSGFNIECEEGWGVDHAAKARFGWCMDTGSKCKKTAANDADGSIGIGLQGQDLKSSAVTNKIGAGHTCLFAVSKQWNTGSGHVCTDRQIPTWIYVLQV